MSGVRQMAKSHWEKLGDKAREESKKAARKGDRSLALLKVSEARLYYERALKNA